MIGLVQCWIRAMGAASASSTRTRTPAAAMPWAAKGVRLCNRANMVLAVPRIMRNLVGEYKGPAEYCNGGYAVALGVILCAGLRASTHARRRMARASTHAQGVVVGKMVGSERPRCLVSAR